MNSITVTVNLSEEDRARLDKIIEALTPQDLEPVKYAGALQVEPQTATTEQPEPTAEPQPEQPAPAAPQHTRAELQHLVVTLTSAGKKAEVRAIVLAVASKVSDIPEDKIDEVFEQLKALEDVNV